MTLRLILTTVGLLLIAAADLALATSAFARGGGPITTNSQGYQRRLEESRQQLVQPAPAPAPRPPLKKKRWR